MDIKSIIKAKRVELGLTMADVAKSVGVSEATVSRWESGNIANMKRGNVASLAKTLGLSASVIMGWGDADDLPNAIPVGGMSPVLGRIPAGVPLLAEENIEGYLPIPYKHPENYFFLRVSGDSMIDAGISDGALVLIKKQPCAENGDIVACRVNGDEATLKRFTQTGDTVILMPANQKYSPIIVSCADFESGQAEIIGIAKQVTRDL